MRSAANVRREVETALAHSIPSALTPAPRTVRPVASTGIEALDAVLNGGLPVGGITELVGPECSGKTSVALSFAARIAQGGKLCAWIDVSDAFDPMSAASVGLDLRRLLWVRCGVAEKSAPRASQRFNLPAQCLVAPPVKQGLHGGGGGPHPRTEGNGMPEAVGGFLRTHAIAPRSAEPQHRIRPAQETFQASRTPDATTPPRPARGCKPWARLEQALRSADLLLQGGGFSAIVLDMGSIAPEFVSRVPLATWFRYRAAAERTQSSILLLTQYACAKSSTALMLRLDAAQAICDEATVFTGIKPRVEVVRQRFAHAESRVTPFRKPPQNVNATTWQSRTAWAGQR